MDNKAFDDGYDAYFFGSYRIDNPYKMTEIEYQDWDDGYMQGMSWDNQHGDDTN